jgi:type II secretory pathway component PulF
MPVSAESHFSYTGTLPAGGEIRGTLMAADQATATLILEQMGIGLGPIEPAMPDRQARQRTSSDGPEGSTFHQRLLRLVQAGLPSAYALCLLRVRGHGSPVARGIAKISRDLDSGIKAVEAVARHRDEIPAEYLSLLEAGISSNNLGAMLVHVRSHLSLAELLADSRRRALYYPALVLAALLAVMSFVNLVAVPLYRPLLYETLHFPRIVGLPLITRAALAVAGAMPEILMAIGVALAAGIFLRAGCRGSNMAAHLRDWVACHVPLFGSPLRLGAAALWCSGLAMAVAAGWALPEAVESAGEICGSPCAAAQGRALVGAISCGLPPAPASPVPVLPELVGTVVQAIVEGSESPDTLTALAQDFRGQAENRAEAVGAVLTTIVLFVSVAVILVATWALFAPFLKLLREIRG